MPPAPPSAADPWVQARAIVARLDAGPRFPARDFGIAAFGARPCATVRVHGAVSAQEMADILAPAPGSFDSQPAIAAAIHACHAAGGGRVVIPSGTWYCAGPIELLSNVHLHLARDCRILFSSDPADFAKSGPYDCGPNGRLVVSRWQGNDCLNFSSMVYARNQRNIALTGSDWSSVLDGQAGVRNARTGASWWDLARRDLAAAADRADCARLPDLSEAGVPLEQRVFGLGHRLRPPMVQLIDCAGVLLQGYQVNQAPFWQHHPVHCTDLVIRKVFANCLGPNSDGFDPECCDQVLVELCTFNSGDDCIAIKAGKNRDTQYGPAQNIVIQDCTMHSGHGGVAIGSETAGGIQHVYAQDLVGLHLDSAIRLKTGLDRGGFLRHIHVRNVKLPNGVRTKPGGAIVNVDCNYAPLADQVPARPPAVHDIHIANVVAGNVEQDGKAVSCYQAIVVLGAVLPVTNVTITDCDFGTPADQAAPWYLCNTKGLILENVRIGGKTFDTTLSA